MSAEHSHLLLLNSPAIKHPGSDDEDSGQQIQDSVQKGDIIYYDKHAGHGIEFEKNKFTVIKLQDVVVVL